MNTGDASLRAVVIDDEPQIRKLIRLALTSEHYEVFEAENGQLGLMEIAYRKPDIVLLDLGLPDVDGVEVIRRLREWSKVPVIVLSVREGVADKVSALDAGADDYLTKPFHNQELFARLRALMRHATGAKTETTVIAGNLKIDLSARAVFRSGSEIHLTATEYAIMRLLAINCGKVVTHSQLLKEIWGPVSEGNSHYLRVYMRQLRKKIEPDPSSPELLINEPGVGYRLLNQAAR
jgi:two-component system, OmpR family, KDP operon response regulator KdpE